MFNGYKEQQKFLYAHFRNMEKKKELFLIKVSFDISLERREYCMELMSSLDKFDAATFRAL